MSVTHILSKAAPVTQRINYAAKQSYRRRISQTYTTVEAALNYC